MYHGVQNFRNFPNVYQESVEPISVQIYITFRDFPTGLSDSTLILVSLFAAELSLKNVLFGGHIVKEGNMFERFLIDDVTIYSQLLNSKGPSRESMARCALGTKT